MALLCGPVGSLVKLSISGTLCGTAELDTPTPCPLLLWTACSRACLSEEYVRSSSVRAACFCKLVTRWPTFFHQRISPLHVAWHAHRATHQRQQTDTVLDRLPPSHTDVFRENCVPRSFHAAFMAWTFACAASCFFMALSFASPRDAEALFESYTNIWCVNFSNLNHGETPLEV